jgi:hypothetical protein
VALYGDAERGKRADYSSSWQEAGLSVSGERR